ncbi:MAG: thiamine ABC transporter substrate binding subunit [Actinomycetota bacterium]
MTRLKCSLITSATVFCVVVSSSCASGANPRESVTLLAYDSFTVPEDAFAEFTADTGVEVDIALGGDAGELVAKVALTSGNPEGDVLWGVDNALLTRLVESEAFDPYVSRISPIDESLLESGRGMVTPVDFGFVCVNYDVAAFDTLGLEPPMKLEDLTRPEYRGMLVVPDATASSPGFAFVLATVSAFPETWPQYWQQLVDNDVAIAGGWTDAYYTQFSRHGGERPLVVSYSTSPPAEVIFSDPPLDSGAPAPTGVIEDTCFQQIEFAGVLRGSDNPDAARALVDFLVGRSFQELLPENLFVYPANQDAALPESFLRYAKPINEPWTLSSDDIARRRVDILDEWSRRVQQ